MLFRNEPYHFMMLDTDGGAGAPADNNNNNDEHKEQQTDYNKLLEGVNIDELLKNEAIAKKVQSIADGRVSQALTTAKAKWEKEQAEAQTEAGKLAKMSEDEKLAYQLKKDRAAFESEKAEFAHSQLQVETAKQLISAGLPDLSAFVTGKDAEETKNNIATLTAALGAWKADALKAATAGTTPKDVSGGGKTITSRDELKQMSPDEVVKAYKEGRIDLKNIK